MYDVLKEWFIKINYWNNKNYCKQSLSKKTDYALGEQAVAKKKYRQILSPIFSDWKQKARFPLTTFMANYQSLRSDKLCDLWIKQLKLLLICSGVFVLIFLKKKSWLNKSS